MGEKKISGKKKKKKKKIKAKKKKKKNETGKSFLMLLLLSVLFAVALSANSVPAADECEILLSYHSRALDRPLDAKFAFSPTGIYKDVTDVLTQMQLNDPNKVCTDRYWGEIPKRE